MKLSPGFVPSLALLITSLFAPAVLAQTLPGSLGLSIQGSFVNGTSQSNTSILITDNDLSNGYDAGFDLTDAPAGLDPSGPAGSAAFQWGDAAGWSAYPHTSSLWLMPLSQISIEPELTFEIGQLFYRNGTIKEHSGASSVDIGMALSFSEPLGIDPISVVFGADLVNSLNSSDPIASADIVSLGSRVAPLEFTDSYGNQYFMELSFRIDQTTIDGTLSTEDQFRVFEGQQGSATLLAKFTTTPVGFNGQLAIPEPSSAMIGALGMLILFRRRR